MTLIRNARDEWISLVRENLARGRTIDHAIEYADGVQKAANEESAINDRINFEARKRFNEDGSRRPFDDQ